MCWNTLEEDLARKGGLRQIQLSIEHAQQSPLPTIFRQYRGGDNRTYFPSGDNRQVCAKYTVSYVEMLCTYTLGVGIYVYKKRVKF